jgi:hypothetical protein
MAEETTITLQPGYFTEKERIFAELGDLAASFFRYDTGVAAIRVRNRRGTVIMLPFQGQQVWDAAFDGRTLTMKSMFSHPYPTRDYMGNYGGFCIHCGATAMGNPGAGDAHPLHGELPNAPYERAFLTVGTDGRGPFMAVSGEYQHTVAFAHNYLARPEVRIYESEAVLPISMTVTNLKRSDMEYMYMAHVNFRPIDDARLVYSAPCTRETARVRTVIPSHVQATPRYRKLLEDLAADPARHNTLTPGMAFDPEVVFFLSYRADAKGWAHSLMVHPDGYASYIRHRPDVLDHGVRWISRTADQDCFGLALPSTAEPDGYHAEKAKGNVKVLPGGKSVRFDVEAGLLIPAEAARVSAEITRILSPA